MLGRTGRSKSEVRASRVGLRLRPPAADYDRVARIVSEGGALVAPAGSPYDLDLVFEYVTRLAMRYGAARLHLEPAEWVVTDHHEDAGPRCTGCHRKHARLLYESGSHALCPRCARREIDAVPNLA